MINIITICTGKYTRFFNDLYASAEKHFLPNHEKNYYVFTDGEIHNASNVIKIHQEQRPWPYSTMMRFHMFNKLLLNDSDYVYFLNANMLFVDDVNEEAIPDSSNDNLMGVAHPGYYDKPMWLLPYERNIISRLHIPLTIGKTYYQGCFNGGRAKEFMQMSNDLAALIDLDLKCGHIPVWHDESALNWYYCFRNPLILNPGYAYPEGWVLPFQQKVLQLDKSKLGGHEYLRS